MSDTITGADVEAARKRLKLSRNAFAELVGLTPTKIHNIEKVRPPKSEEIEKLRPHVTVGEGGAPPVATPASGDAVPPPPSSATEVEAEGPIVMLSDEELDEELATLMGDVPASDDAQVIQFPQQPGALPLLPDTPPEPNGVVSQATAPEPELAPSPEVAQPEPIAEVVTLDDGIRRVTHGEFQTFKRCRRKWWLAYHRQLGLPKEPLTGAAPLGTRVHQALAGWYVPDGTEKVDPFTTFANGVERDMLKLQEANDVGGLEDLLKEAELGRIMLEGYFEWIAETGADEGLQIVGAEQMIEVASGFGDVRLLGKLDVRAIRTFDGARLFIDHKTVGSFAQHTKWLHMKEQPKHYLLLEFLKLREEGLEHERSTGALWNMLRKVKRTATANPPFYERVEIIHNLDVLRSYWQHLIGGLQAIEYVREQLDAGWDHHAVAYPTPSDACSWDCDFFAVCPMFDDGSRVEDFVSVNFVQVNPLKRYEPEGSVDA